MFGPVRNWMGQSNGAQSRLPRLRVFDFGMNHFIRNLGDALTPYVLAGLGFECAGIHMDDKDVINSGRCLLTMGSFLSGDCLRLLEFPLDIWGSGWKGKERMDLVQPDMRVHAVRGPLTAKGLDLPMSIPLGDPALLIPFLFPKPVVSHNKSIVIRHIFRFNSQTAARCAEASGCDESKTSRTYVEPRLKFVKSIDLNGFLADVWYWKKYQRAGVSSIQSLIHQIAGASFVLTGSLHCAILAQAYGIPWSAYTDGFVDVPPKWEDWGAYLGVDIGFARTLDEGREWWRETGRFGQTRSLQPLIEAFPHLDASPRAQCLATTIDSMPQFAFPRN